MQQGRTPIGTVTITGAFSYTGKYATQLLLEARISRAHSDQPPRPKESFWQSGRSLSLSF